MRLSILSAIFSAALFAQTPPPPDQTPKAETQAVPAPADQSDVLQQLKEAAAALQAQRGTVLFGQPAKPITITLAPRKPCSVPLVNVLRVEPRDPIQVPVKKPEKFTMPHVSLPAPPCDNLK